MNQEKDMDTDRKLSCGPEKDKQGRRILVIISSGSMIS